MPDFIANFPFLISNERVRLLINIVIFERHYLFGRDHHSVEQESEIVFSKSINALFIFKEG